MRFHIFYILLLLLLLLLLLPLPLVSPGRWAVPDLRASHSCQSPVHLDSRNRPEYGNPLEKYYWKSCHSPKKHSFLDEGGRQFGQRGWTNLAVVGGKNFQNFTNANKFIEGCQKFANFYVGCVLVGLFVHILLMIVVQCSFIVWRRGLTSNGAACCSQLSQK